MKFRIKLSFLVVFLSYIVKICYFGTILYFENDLYLGITSYFYSAGFLILSPGWHSSGAAAVVVGADSWLLSTFVDLGRAPADRGKMRTDLDYGA